MRTPVKSKSVTRKSAPTSLTKRPLLLLCAGTDELGIAVGGKTRLWRHDQYYRDDMLVEVAKLLDKIGLRPSALGGVVVYSGPGSFTGLRVGVTIANGIGTTLGIGIRAVNEYDLLKKWWAQTELAVLPASRNEVLVGDSKGFATLPPSALIKRVKTGSRVCVGSAGLLATLHPYLRGAGTIRIAELSTTDRLGLMEGFNVPKKYRQVLPEYGREPNITLSPKKR